MLDTTHTIATPEGVELKLPVAGLASRSLAWLLDAMIKFIILIAATITFELTGDFGVGLILITSFVILWFYNVLFEVLNHGATPGKRVLGLRVMNINGTPVGWTGSLIRNLIRFVDTLPGCYAFGCVSVLLSEQFQRLGDLAAGTIVVHHPKHATLARSVDSESIAVKVPLTADEQQAIMSFGERAPTLNQERAEELAALLRPLLADVDAARLQAHANHIAGGARDK